MEWLIGSVFIPFVIWLWNVHRDRKSDYERNEERFYEVESRVTVLEQKVEVLERDVTEIQELNDKIEKIQLDVMRVITMLEERTNKGQ